MHAVKIIIREGKRREEEKSEAHARQLASRHLEQLTSRPGRRRDADAHEDAQDTLSH